MGTPQARRPASILFFSLCFLLSPLVLLAKAAIIHGLPLWGPEAVFYFLHPADIVIMALYPLAALSIYSVTRPGWWIFIGICSILIGYNILVYILKPSTGLASTVVFNLVFVATAAWFFRGHVIAPYFNPHIRDWAMARRFQPWLLAAVETGDGTIPVRLVDLSMGGVFFRTDAPLPLAENGVWLRMDHGDEVLRLQGTMVRTTEFPDGGHGHGLRFLPLDDSQKHCLGLVMSKLTHLPGHDESSASSPDGGRRTWPRVGLAPGAHIHISSGSHVVRLENIALSGCAVDGAPEWEAGRHVVLEIDSPLRIKVPARVVWTHTWGQRQYLGLHFSLMSRKARRAIKAYLDTLESMHSLGPEAVDSRLKEQVLEDTLAHSPYGVVLALKRRFAR